MASRAERGRRGGAALAALLLAALTGTAQARSIPQPGLPPSVGATPAGATGYRPAVNYQLQCAGCHLGDGRGARASLVPKMKDFVGRFLDVDGGREFLVRVPGVAQSGLSDAELAELLNWLLTGDIAGASRPAQFVPYTTEEVARQRHEPLIDVFRTRAGLIAAMRARGIAIDDDFTP